MAEAMAEAGHDPAHLGRRPRDAAPDRHVRRAARRAGPRPWSTSADPVGVGVGDLAARPVAARLRRRGQPRGHHPAGGPPRPDAGATPRPCSPRASTAAGARLPRDRRQGARRAGRRQRHPVPGHRAGWTPAAPVDRRRARGGRRASARRPGWSRSEESWTPETAFDAALAARPGAGCSTAAPLLSHRRRARRRHPGHRGALDRDAVRPQPDRGLALARGARRARRLPRRRRGAGASRPRAGRMSAGSPRRWFAEHALLPSGPARAVLLEVADGRFTAVTPGQPRRPTPNGCAGVVLPGLANAHSHAFHRALRGRTHAGGGTFWTWREGMYAVAARLDPDTYLALARATFAEMALAGVHLRGRVPLPAPRGRAAAVRRPERDGRGAAPGRRGGRASGSPCWTPATSPAGSPPTATLPLDERAAPVRRRHRRALGRARARAAPVAGARASVRRSTRCGPCRATSIGAVVRRRRGRCRCTCTSPSSRPRTTPAWASTARPRPSCSTTRARSARGPRRCTPPT